MRTTKSRWDAAEAAAFDDDLGLRVYTSRLLGLDPSLVLHGGGNTSVKGAVRTLLDEDVVDVLYVKGSGWNLETIEPAGFAPVRLDALLALSRLDALSDVEMARQLRLATLDPAAPAPSVEAILHAILPYRYVDHTHPDLLISVMNTPSGEARVREIYGDDVVVVPYVMPGFPLSRLCAAEFPRQVREGTLGMVLMHHGLFTFGDTAREAYERTIELVGRAEDYLREHDALDLEPAAGPEPGAVRVDIADLRRAVSDAAGRPLLLTRSGDAAGSAYARRVDLARVSQSGPATPDHVIRTKRVPLLGRDVATYATAYSGYVAEHQDRAPLPLTPLDPAPRVILDPELGLLAAGQSAAETGVILDIALHTAAIVERAESSGGMARSSAGGRVRRRVLGPGAGEAPGSRAAATVRRRGRSRHGRGLGHRARLLRGVPRPRSSGCRPRSRRHRRPGCSSARVSRHPLRHHRRGRST